MTRRQNRYFAFINVYAPTMPHPGEQNKIFYAQLRDIVAWVSSGDRLITLGVFNPIVCDDRDTWNLTIGKFGWCNHDHNGLPLACLCTEMELAITNTTSNTLKSTSSPGLTRGQNGLTLLTTLLQEEWPKRYLGRKSNARPRQGYRPLPNKDKVKLLNQTTVQLNSSPLQAKTGCSKTQHFQLSRWT